MKLSSYILAGSLTLAGLGCNSWVVPGPTTVDIGYRTLGFDAAWAAVHASKYHVLESDRRKRMLLVVAKVDGHKHFYAEEPLEEAPSQITRLMLRVSDSGVVEITAMGHHQKGHSLHRKLHLEILQLLAVVEAKAAELQAGPPPAYMLEPPNDRAESKER